MVVSRAVALVALVLGALVLAAVPAGGQGGAASYLTLNAVAYDPPSGPVPGCNAPLPTGGTGSFTYDDPGGGYRQTWEWSLPQTITSGQSAAATIKVTGQTFNNGGLTTSMTLGSPGGLGTNSGARGQIDAVVPAGAPGTDTEQETHTYSPTRAFAEGEKVYIRVGIGCVGYLHEYVGHAATPTTTATTTTTTTLPPTCGFRQVCSNAVTVSGVKGKVEFSVDQGSWTPGRNGAKLRAGDRIHTGFKAGVVLTYPDGSTLTVAPMSIITLGDVNAGPEGVTSRAQIRMGAATGDVIKRQGSEADFKLITPTTTAGVRGTRFTVAYDGSATTVSVAESAVQVTANSGATQLVQAGQETRSTATTVAVPTPIGKGFRRGGLTSAQALSRVTAVLGPALKRCRLAPRSATLAPVVGGWRAALVIVGSTEGIAAKPRGTARFRLSGRRLRPTNPLGRRVVRGCRKR